MTRYAIIEDGVVQNATKADAGFAASQGWVTCPDNVGPGWGYDNGNWSEPVGPTPEDEDVNVEREHRLISGTSFTVAGVADPIALQGRPFDQTVYLALLTRASGYKAAGVTDPVLRIRSTDDVIYMLTPDQMISLISQAMTWFESVMATSWAMKDKTGDFTGGIPADYSSDTYWP